MPRHRLSAGSARVEQARAASRDGPGGGSGSDEHPRRGPRRPTRYSRRRLRQPSWLRCAGTSVRRNFGAPELRCAGTSVHQRLRLRGWLRCARDFGTPGLRCAGAFKSNRAQHRRSSFPGQVARSWRVSPKTPPRAQLSYSPGSVKNHPCPSQGARENCIGSILIQDRWPSKREHFC